MKKFSLRKKLLPSVMAAALVSGFAFSGSANAVEVAADGTGQVLLGPLYIVAARHAETDEVLVRGTTHIRIINSSSTHAVKARIAFRSKVNCTEVLDFILYLSPNDAWRGRVVNVDDQAYLVSDDDSVRNLPNDDSFASVEGKTANVKFFDVNLAGNDYNEMGIFEVIGAYSARGTVITPLGNVIVEQGMSKFELRKIFDTSIETLLDRNGCTSGATGGCVIRTDEPASVQLRGEVSIDIGEKISYPMLALDQGGDTTDVNGGKVIANPYYDVAVKMSVDMGYLFGKNGDDTISDIEAALSGKSFISANENNSIVFITLPTKYRHFDDKPGSALDTWTFPFNSTGSVDYGLRQFDNQEREAESTSIAVSGGKTSEQTITSCVEWFMPNWAFDSGWYSLELDMIRATGVPAWVGTLNGLGGDFFLNSRIQ